MQLVELSKQYQNFTVPNYQVLVGGKDVLRELLLSVPSIEVDLQEKTSGRFSFVIANAFNWEKRAFVAGERAQKIDLLDTFSFGAPIVIRMGYGDVSKLRTLLVGTVTEVKTAFTQGETPQLEVSGYDALYPLSLGNEGDSWEDKRDSDAVREMIGQSGLSTKIIPTDTKKLRIERTQESQLAFVKKLAERNGYTFYVQKKSFYFGPRNNSGKAKVELPWGKGLLSFTPEANLSRQVEAVELSGWSAELGKFISGASRLRDVTGIDAGRLSGSELVAKAFNSKPINRSRIPVHSQAEALSRAKALLENRTQGFLKAQADTLGLPEIVPDINIAFSGLGDRFSKTYYVTGSVHKIDDSGYNTSVSLQETSL